MVIVGHDISIEKIFLYVPLTASITAIAYDVGFFKEVDISMFTVFSFSEHLVFAMQAFPFLFIFISVMAALVSTFAIFEKEIMSAFGTLNRRRLLFVICMAVILPIDIAVGLYWRHVREIVSSLSVVLMLMMFSFIWVSDVRQRFVFLFLAFLFFCLSVPYDIGAMSAREHLAGELPTHVLITKNSSILGNLVRSGERGVLFAQQRNKKVLFKRWDEIQHIEQFEEHRF